MSILEALKGAQQELARLHSSVDKARRVATYARIFAAELLGTVLAVPYGYRALTLHRSLPNAGIGAQRQQGSVSILRDVRYGERQRNVMDIYLPATVSIQEMPLLSTNTASEGSGGASASAAAGGRSHAAQLQEQDGGGAPVVLFCHGGVWASGSKWHYAPMATRLAQAGVITAVMQYTLYPQAMVADMNAEVSIALSWLFDHIARLGGDASKVSLVGHSAGAHMCAMALLHRSLETSRRQQQQHKGAAAHISGDPSSSSANGKSGVFQSPAEVKKSGGTAVTTGASGSGAYDDPRMPALYIGMAGVYNIQQHYVYEQGRDVHELSTMKRACGGEAGFASQSPAVILARALERGQGRLKEEHRCWERMQANPGELLEEAEAAIAGPKPQRAEQQERQQQGAFDGPASPRSPSQARPLALWGETVARRIGFERVSSSRSSLGGNGSSGSTSGSSWMMGSSGVAQQYNSYLPPAPPGLVQQAEYGQQAGAKNRILDFTVEDARRLPPCILMSSFVDMTVPWYESSEMYWMLHDCGVPAKHLVYPKAQHADFVVGWWPRAVLGSAAVDNEGDLPDFAADLVQVVAGRGTVAFSQ